MTNEQAINELKDWQTAFSHMGKDMSYAIESFDMAIKALSAQPEIIRCEECIHRFDNDCPIDWNGKEFCSFGERGDSECSK